MTDDVGGWATTLRAACWTRVARTAILSGRCGSLGGRYNVPPCTSRRLTHLPTLTIEHLSATV